MPRKKKKKERKMEGKKKEEENLLDNLLLKLLSENMFGLLRGRGGIGFRNQGNGILVTKK